MPVLHLFDFDGTLSERDSLFDFWKFAAPQLEPKRNFYATVLLSLPSFVMAYLGLRSKDLAKEAFIRNFLKGQRQELIARIAKDYAKTYPELLHEKALIKLEELRKNPVEHTCYMVSASVDCWLQPMAEALDMKLICTKAALVNGVYTGRFEGNNCNREEKKRRIEAEIDLSRFDKVIAYGDSSGDKAMFSLADETYFKPFA